MTAAARSALPPRFEAVGEALASGSNSAVSCGFVGRELASDGASLIEALDALRQTYGAVVGHEPAYDDVIALSQAWSEATLGYLHQLSCEDPMTGLASLAHLRSRLSELYRGQRAPDARVAALHALVVADLPHAAHSSDNLSRALRLARVGDCARTVFAGAETIGRLGAHRVAVLVARDEQLGQRVALLRRMVNQRGQHAPRARVWIEGLPSTDSGAAALLDELARS